MTGGVRAAVLAGGCKLIATIGLGAAHAGTAHMATKPQTAYIRYFARCGVGADAGASNCVIVNDSLTWKSSIDSCWETTCCRFLNCNEVCLSAQGV